MDLLVLVLRWSNAEGGSITANQTLTRADTLFRELPASRLALLAIELAGSALDSVRSSARPCGQTSHADAIVVWHPVVFRTVC